MVTLTIVRDSSSDSVCISPPHPYINDFFLLPSHQNITISLYVYHQNMNRVNDCSNTSTTFICMYIMC